MRRDKEEKSEEQESDRFDSGREREDFDIMEMEQIKHTCTDEKSSKGEKLKKKKKSFAGTENKENGIEMKVMCSSKEKRKEEDKSRRTMETEDSEEERCSIARTESEMDKVDKQIAEERKEYTYIKINEVKEEDKEDRCSVVSIPASAWFYEETHCQKMKEDVTLQRSRNYGGTTSSRGGEEEEEEVRMESSRCRCCSSWHPWFFIGLGWLPIMVGIFLSLSIVIPYCIAVGLSHVSPGFPYISDSGTVPPESCIFGQLLNMAAGLGLAGIYVRYKQVELYSEDYDASRRMLLVNKASLVLGVIACFGMSIVANFQVGNVLAVHFTGAFLLFAPGAVYGFLQAWVSYKMYPRHASLAVCHIRLVLSVIIAVFFTLCTLFTLIAQEKTIQSGSILHWGPADGGYPEHIVATVSEWVVAIAFLLYFFTFIREFQKITIQAELKHHLVYDGLVDANSYPPVANYDNSYSATL